MTIIRTIPEPGQLVRLRQRQYVVTDVRQSIAPTRISSAGLQKSQHFVSLASIEDDVGLGKTIEAGLVLQELIVRNRCRRALIVCPSALQPTFRTSTFTTCIGHEDSTV